MEINWIGELFDTIASLTGQYGRWLNANKKRVCFIIWSCCVIYWACVDFYRGLYAQTLFCCFSLCLNIYGYIKWKK